MNTGLRHHVVCLFMPQLFRYQVRLLGDIEKHGCEELAQLLLDNVAAGAQSWDH